MEKVDGEDEWKGSEGGRAKKAEEVGKTERRKRERTRREGMAMGGKGEKKGREKQTCSLRSPIGGLM